MTAAAAPLRDCAGAIVAARALIRAARLPHPNAHPSALLELAEVELVAALETLTEIHLRSLGPRPEVRG